MSAAPRTPRAPLLARGVWEAPYRLEGDPVLCAIDRHGNIIDWRIVTVGKNADAMVAEMLAVLDAKDATPIHPISRLSLHRASASA